MKARTERLQKARTERLQKARTERIQGPLPKAVLALLVLLGAIVLWAMCAPVGAGSREQLFEIPAGTYDRRAAGDKAGILPAEIRLTLGLKDVLVLRNLDRVPQTFGPVLIMPGQSFKLPFNAASDYQFDCTAHASGRMRIIVDPAPAMGWPRLMWRWRSLTQRGAT